MKNTVCIPLGPQEIKVKLNNKATLMTLICYDIYIHSDNYPVVKDTYAVVYNNIRDGFRIMTDNCMLDGEIIFDLATTIPTILFSTLLDNKENSGTC